MKEKWIGLGTAPSLPDYVEAWAAGELTSETRGHRLVVLVGSKPVRSVASGRNDDVPPSPLPPPAGFIPAMAALLK